MAPFFSLILPVYNVAAYLERCLNSILTQSCSDYEIILVDDGSTDRSPEICDAYAHAHECIRVIHKENGGLSSARNAGLENALGQYIWFIDSDDWIAPDALTTLREACAGDVDMVKFSFKRVTDRTEAAVFAAPAGLYEGAAMEPLLRQAFCEAGQFVLSAWSHVYRRAFLDQHGLIFVSERSVGSEDYLYVLSAMMHATSLRVLEDHLYSYEIRSGSLTQQYKADLPKRYAKLRKLLLEACETHANADELAALAERFFIWHLLVGTCFTYEYCHITAEHTLADGRRNVRAILKMPELKAALKRCDRTNLSVKKWLQLLGLRLRMEGLFYWLFVRKNRR